MSIVIGTKQIPLTPTANPSNPSSQFIEFVIAATQQIVKIKLIVLGKDISPFEKRGKVIV